MRSFTLFRMRLWNFSTVSILGIIFIYQRFLSPWKGLVFQNQTCRFFPSCSEYTRLSITKLGALKGGAKSLKRLLSCHPFHPGGVDVPD